MIRILFFVALIFLLGLGFAWLADRPGELVVTFGGYQYRVTLMVAAAMTAALVASVMILWWLVKGIWNSPYTVARYFRVRRRDRGYQALSTGMIAAGAGDSALARRMNRQAAKLINSDREPLIHLLDAQTSLLEGDHDGAREKFRAMLDDPEMRILGLRGLYLEAERLGEREAARHYAAEAVEIAPQLGWAANATIEARTAEGDWDGALRLLDAQRSGRQVDRDVANRRRAVLLTAKAMSLMGTDPLAAKNAAIEANRLAPDLVPAAVTAAKALFEQGDLKKGARILESVWRKEPHPDVAETYVHARHGDSTHDRLKRARKLQSLKQNHPESALAVARAALAAGEFREAREAAESAIRLAPREGAYLLMADIEEAETGDAGRIRQLLAKAVRAEPDPAWTADGYVSDRWAPVSPITGRLDAFEWRAPLERLGGLIEQKEAEEAPALPLVTVEAEPIAEAEEAYAETVVPPAPAAPAPAASEAPRPVPAASTSAAAAGATPLAAAAQPANDDRHARPAASPAVPADRTAGEGRPAERRDEPRALQLPQPDDPGVSEDQQGEEKRGFRLF